MSHLTDLLEALAAAAIEWRAARLESGAPRRWLAEQRLSEAVRRYVEEAEPQEKE